MVLYYLIIVKAIVKVIVKAIVKVLQNQCFSLLPHPHHPPPLPDSIHSWCLPLSYVPHWSGTDFIVSSSGLPPAILPFNESQLSHKLFGQMTNSVTISNRLANLFLLILYREFGNLTGCDDFISLLMF